MSATNRQWKLVARPVGLPKRSDFELVEEPVPSPNDGEVLVEISHVSLDPAMRGWMNDGRSYIPPVGLGEVMRAGAIGRVVESHSPRFEAGDHVTGWLGVQDYAAADAHGLVKVDAEAAPLPVYLGTLGLPGLTAYFGLLDIGRPEAGQTVVVSGAAGAVGSVVGQIAKIKGCRAVGIAGGAEKCAWLVDELGFDAAIDYKSDNLYRALGEYCPDGIDVYFDNVGGDILDAALSRLAMGARIVLSGAISQYNNTGAMTGPANYMALLVKRASMTGFVVMDYGARFPEAIAEMAGWLADGRLKSREDVVVGLETFPESLLKLFAGENTGKLVLQNR